MQRRFARFFSREDAKLLLVAGAAAGVAAIFKAPATGALFAIEVPYRADIARRNVLPAMVAAATSYVTFAPFDGTTPILPIDGEARSTGRTSAGRWWWASCVGPGPAVQRRAAVRSDGRSVASTPLADPASLAGLALAVLAWLSDGAADAPLSLGPGYDVIQWATHPDEGVLAGPVPAPRGLVAVLATAGAVRRPVHPAGGEGR